MFFETELNVFLKDHASFRTDFDEHYFKRGESSTSASDAYVRGQLFYEGTGDVAQRENLCSEESCVRLRLRKRLRDGESPIFACTSWMTSSLETGIIARDGFALPSSFDQLQIVSSVEVERAPRSAFV